jgi:hypothetical protein
MKPKPAKQQAHMARVASLPCLVCGAQATVHHVTASAHVIGRLPRSDELVVPLCPMHHQKVHDPKANDPVSVEGLNHRGFYEKHGVDLLAAAEFLRLESVHEGIL